jgi:hypothetical protein
MSTEMYKDMTLEERVQLMTNQAYKVIEEDYQKPVGDDEISAEQSFVSQELLQIAELEAEKKKITAEIAGKIKGIKAIQTARLAVISSGKRKVFGKIWLFPDQQSGKMRYFDQYGDLISTRKLQSHEKQTTLFINDDNTVSHKEATDNATEDTDFEEVAAKNVQVEIPADTDTEVPPEAQTQPEAPKTGKQGKKKTVKQRAAEAKGYLNDKVAQMTESHKARKEASTNQAERTDSSPAIGEEAGTDETEVQGTEEETAEGTEADAGQQIEETPGFTQIPREETFNPNGIIDPDDDDLPM